MVNVTVNAQCHDFILSIIHRFNDSSFHFLLVGVLHDQLVAQMEESMHQLVKCVQQIAVNIYSKFRCRIV